MRMDQSYYEIPRKQIGRPIPLPALANIQIYTGSENSGLVDHWEMIQVDQ